MGGRRQDQHPLPGCPGEPSAGVDALKKADRNKLNMAGLVARASVDIDLSFRASEPNASRWDYFIDFERRGEIYAEVHELSETEFNRILQKAAWLRTKMASHGWPDSGRPLLLAPTAGISPFSLFGDLSRRLAVHRIAIVRKGDPVADFLE